MGSIFRIPCCKFSFVELRQTFHDWTYYASDLQGEDIEHLDVSLKSILVVGQEGSGISNEVKSMADHLVKIKKSGKSDVDSLNVGVATGILLYKFIHIEKG